MENEKRKLPIPALIAVVISLFIFVGFVFLRQNIVASDDEQNLVVTTPVVSEVREPLSFIMRPVGISNLPSPFYVKIENAQMVSSVPPIPPGLPNQPPLLPDGVPISSFSAITKPKVKAIFYGGDERQNLAIMSVDSEEFTIFEGQLSKLGKVSKINQDHVVINNVTYWMNYENSDTETVTQHLGQPPILGMSEPFIGR